MSARNDSANKKILYHLVSANNIACLWSSFSGEIENFGFGHSVEFVHYAQCLQGEFHV
jgi:hypothetical protein